MPDKDVGNLKIGFTGDATELRGDVAGAVASMESAFGQSRPEINPVVGPVDIPEPDAPAMALPDLSPLVAAVRQMTTASSAVGMTLAEGFSRVIPIIARMDGAMGHVAAQAQRANREAWRDDLMKRAEAATTRWGKALANVERTAFGVMGAYEKVERVSHRLQTLKAGHVGAWLSGGAKGVGGMASAAAMAPVRAVGSAASGAKQGLGDALSEASGGSGAGGFLGALVGGGLAGGVAVLVKDTLEWAKSSTAVMAAWDGIKSVVMPFVTGFTDALAPVGTMVMAVGQAAKEVFGNLFASSTATAAGEVSTLASAVTDWVKQAVDGGNIVLDALGYVGEGIALVADHTGKVTAAWHAFRGVASYAVAGVLTGVDAMGSGLAKLLNLIPGVSVEWTTAFGSMAATMTAIGDDAMGKAVEAWNAPGLGEAVRKITGDIKSRASEIAKELAKPAEDTSWLKPLNDAWNKALDGMATRAKGLLDGLMTPMDKLAEKFNEIDQLQAGGFLSSLDSERLKRQAAGSFLGDSANARPAAMEAGSREARSTLLDWRSSRSDPLSQLPDLSAKQLEVQSRNLDVNERIARALESNHDLPMMAMGN